MSYLSLGQVQLPRQLGPFPSHNVLTPLELHLQTVELLCRERGPSPFGPVQIQTFGQDYLSDRAFSVWTHRGLRFVTVAEENYKLSRPALTLDK